MEKYFTSWQNATATSYISINPTVSAAGIVYWWVVFSALCRSTHGGKCNWIHAPHLNYNTIRKHVGMTLGVGLVFQVNYRLFIHCLLIFQDCRDQTTICVMTTYFCIIFHPLTWRENILCRLLFICYYTIQNQLPWQYNTLKQVEFDSKNNKHLVIT